MNFLKNLKINSIVSIMYISKLNCLMKRYLSKIAVLVITVLFPFIVNSGVFAQATPVSVSLSPSTGTYAAGASFVSSINMNTGGATVSAAQLVITFDKAKLQITNFEYGDAVPAVEKGLLQDLWVINNTDGFISIPVLWLYGYQGSGRIANITFRGVSAGSTTLNFADANGETNVAYDQAGENNILGTKTGATYTIGAGGGTTTPPSTTPPSTTRPPTSSSGSSSNLPDSGIEDYAFLILGVLLIAIASSSVVVIKKKSTTS